MERNEKYWDKNYTGYYKNIKFVFIPDTASRVLAVKSGDANVAHRINVSDYVGLKNDPSAKGVMFSTDRVQNLYFNVSSDTPFKDPKVRSCCLPD